MDIKNQSDLGKLIDLCRKKGVESVEINGIKLTLRAEAPPSYYKKKQEPADAVTDEKPLTEEELLFYSVQSGGMLSG